MGGRDQTGSASRRASGEMVVMRVRRLQFIAGQLGQGVANINQKGTPVRVFVV